MQAPIGPATTPELVIGVSETGALGTLAASWTEPRVLRDQIRQIGGATTRPYCVNLVLAFDQRDRLDVALAEGTPFVSFSWGVEESMIRRAHQGGARVLVQVGTVAEASAATVAGADIIIIQGVEAGGHVQAAGRLLELVRVVREAVRRPIVAAGGIADPDGARRAVAAGADGVACGTAFLAAREADVHPTYVQRLIEAGPADTVLTHLFDQGWPDAPHRILHNTTVTRWQDAGEPRSGDRPGEGDIVGHRSGTPIVRYSDAQPTRETTGDIEAMAMYAGLSAAYVKRTDRAALITERIAAGL